MEPPDRQFGSWGGRIKNPKETWPKTTTTLTIELGRAYVRVSQDVEYSIVVYEQISVEDRSEYQTLKRTERFAVFGPKRQAPGEFTSDHATLMPPGAVFDGIGRTRHDWA
jgi:hypothetical protein